MRIRTLLAAVALALGGLIAFAPAAHAAVAQEGDLSPETEECIKQATEKATTSRTARRRRA